MHTFTHTHTHTYICTTHTDLLEAGWKQLEVVMQNKKGCYLQGQGHSEALYNQSVTISELIIILA